MNCPFLAPGILLAAKFWANCNKFDQRNLFSGVYFCDVTLEEMFVVPVNQFNVIIASLVFDVVAISDKMYIAALKNVLQYLKVRSTNKLN